MILAPWWERRTIWSCAHAWRFSKQSQRIRLFSVKCWKSIITADGIEKHSECWNLNRSKIKIDKAFIVATFFFIEVRLMIFSKTLSLRQNIFTAAGNGRTVLHTKKFNWLRDSIPTVGSVRFFCGTVNIAPQLRLRAYFCRLLLYRVSLPCWQGFLMILAVCQSTETALRQRSI